MTAIDDKLNEAKAVKERVEAISKRQDHIIGALTLLEEFVLHCNSLMEGDDPAEGARMWENAGREFPKWLNQQMELNHGAMSAVTEELEQMK